MNRSVTSTSGIFPSQPPSGTLRVYRPVGDVELRRILAGGRTRFPPLLPSQRHFFPMRTRSSAENLAREFRELGRGAGHVLACDVRAAFLSRYPQHGLGEHVEHRIPAEDLDAFNDAIVGLIEVVATFGAVRLG